jgi:D-alanyl-D-alanine carboxypeptidase
LLFFFVEENTPNGAKLLLKHYPQITKYQNNYLYFTDGTSLIYDDGQTKTTQQLLDNPDIEDQFFYQYQNFNATIKTDAGRIRNEAFFKKIYGNTKTEVTNNLTEIAWCPKLVNQKIKVTTINNMHLKVQSLSNELDKKPKLKKYLTNIGGTFNWRFINGTKRLSMHSFGMTIDINTKYANYWQWDCKCKTETTKLTYKNQIPEEIVNIFEKHGFIWGGNWQHYDSMHFEYRPELLEK